MLMQQLPFALLFAQAHADPTPAQLENRFNHRIIHPYITINYSQIRSDMNIKILAFDAYSFRHKASILLPECLIGFDTSHFHTDIDQTDLRSAQLNNILDLESSYGIIPLLKKCHDFPSQLFIPKNLHQIFLNRTSQT